MKRYDAVHKLTLIFGTLTVAGMLGVCRETVANHIRRKSTMRADRRTLAKRYVRYYLGARP